MGSARTLGVGFLLTCSLCVGPAEAVAQDSPSATGHASSSNLELLTALTTEIHYLAPGKGFNAAQLGDRLDIVVADWGRPQLQRNSGLIKRTRELSYQLDEFTAVRFRGRQRLEAISVEGLPGSRVQTVEGAQFGIEPAQLVQLYGRPPQAARNGKMEYPSLGISFAFDHNRLRRIAVYPANR